MSSTTKINKHTTSAIITEAISNIITDCMKTFCKDLKEHVAK